MLCHHRPLLPHSTCSVLDGGCCLFIHFFSWKKKTNKPKSFFFFPWTVDEEWVGLEDGLVVAREWEWANERRAGARGEKERKCKARVERTVCAMRQREAAPNDCESLDELVAFGARVWSGVTGWRVRPSWRHSIHCYPGDACHVVFLWSLPLSLKIEHKKHRNQCSGMFSDTNMCTFPCYITMWMLWRVCAFLSCHWPICVTMWLDAGDCLSWLGGARACVCVGGGGAPCELGVCSLGICWCV